MSFFWLTTYLCYSIGVSALENGAMLVQVELQGYLETEVSVTVVTDDGTGKKCN